MFCTIHFWLIFSMVQKKSSKMVQESPIIHLALNWLFGNMEELYLIFWKQNKTEVQGRCPS